MVITPIPCQPCRPATRFLPSALTVTMFVTVAHLPGHDARAVPTPVIVTGVFSHTPQGDNWLSVDFNGHERPAMERRAA